MSPSLPRPLSRLPSFFAQQNLQYTALWVSLFTSTSLCVSNNVCLLVIRDKSATYLLLDPLVAYGVLWLKPSNNKNNNAKTARKRAKKGRLKTLPQNFDAISAYIIKSGELDKGYPIDGFEWLRLAFQYPIIRKTFAHTHTLDSKKSKDSIGKNKKTANKNRPFELVQSCPNMHESGCKHAWFIGDWFCDNRQKLYRLILFLPLFRCVHK